jgi:hypothetical protein
MVCLIGHSASVSGIEHHGLLGNVFILFTFTKRYISRCYGIVFLLETGIGIGWDLRVSVVSLNGISVTGVGGVSLLSRMFSDRGLMNNYWDSDTLRYPTSRYSLPQ